MSEGLDRYYHPSGRIPIVGTASMLTLGTLVALVLGFIYAVISRYNPIIYVQVFVTLGFGAAMGITVRRVGHWTKVRNRIFRILISMLIGLMGLYFAWVWYIFVLSDWDTSLLIFDPQVTATIIQELAAVGVWEFKNAKPTGYVLYAFWLIEAGIVLCMCYLTGSEVEEPFCEECDCWTKPGDLLVVAKCETGSLKESLEEEQYDVVPKLTELELDASDFLSVQCFTCPHCEESGYLTVSRVVTVPGQDGPTVTATVVIPPMAVPHSVTKQVEQLAKNPVRRTVLPEGLETEIPPGGPEGETK